MSVTTANKGDERLAADLVPHRLPCDERLHGSFPVCAASTHCSIEASSGT